MIEIILTSADLARIRFARSPVEELVHSVPALVSNGRNMMHRPWAVAVRPRVSGVNIEVLLALAGGRFVPDFLAPTPDQMTGVLTDELEAIRSSTPEAVRAGLDELRNNGPLPGALQSLYDSPKRELGKLVDLMLRYWQAAVEPVWARLSAAHDADISYRAGELTRGGFDYIFAGLHPEVEYTGDRLRINKRHNAVRLADGAGLLLVPCVFAWPKLLVLHNEPYQPALTYPPRGVAQVWASSSAQQTEPLGELLGRSRASVLAHLDLPLTTSQLASYLDISAAAVSQHLAVLRRCQLVTARRSGRWVLYQRTPLATSLFDAIS